MENTLAKVDLGRYRRIVQMFWDPEPTNDITADQPVWCLGCSYQLGGKLSASFDEAESKGTKPNQEEQEKTGQPTVEAPLSHIQVDNAQESTPSSFSSSLAYEDEPSQGGGWPPGFIEDFEARFWMTYRSEFEPIRRSSDPKATLAMSLAMRIKTQLGDQTGFSTDSGWGCMIRSGQSLLANTIALLRLGRSQYTRPAPDAITWPSKSLPVGIMLTFADWRRGDSPFEEREVIRMFADDPRAPYSIHNFVQHGATACGKYPGEWFGPSATARCIQ